MFVVERLADPYLSPRLVKAFDGFWSLSVRRDSLMESLLLSD